MKHFIGRGLTDHPTSNEVTTFVTNIDNVAIPKDSHAKIIFYSRGLRDGNQIRYPFNVEMNINHEYWHLRDNDPNERGQSAPPLAAQMTRPESISNSASAIAWMT